MIFPNFLPPYATNNSLNEQGVCSAAPFGFFNHMGDDPPILIICFERKPYGEMKDTARSILLQKEFVLNLIDEGITERMHHCATNFQLPVHKARGLAALP